MGLKYNNFCENITPYHSRRSMYHALVNAFLSPPLAWREESYFDEIPVIVQGQCHENGMCGTHNNRPTTILSLICSDISVFLLMTVQILILIFFFQSQNSLKTPASNIIYSYIYTVKYMSMNVFVLYVHKYLCK